MSAAEPLRIEHGDAWEGDEPPLFLNDAGLATLAPKAFDLAGILPTGGLSYLVGLKGAGKTLLAIDWACSLALGRTWYGCKAERGRVIYLAAEGSRSLHSRVEVWKGHHGYEHRETGVQWHPHRLALHKPNAVVTFIERVRYLLPGPIRQLVIDTQPRCTQGINENDPADMGRVLESVDYLRESLNTGVLLLTHPNREGGDLPRGQDRRKAPPMQSGRSKTKTASGS